GDVRDLSVIERRLFGRFHVDARLLVEHRAADAVPVEPAAEVAPGQAVGGDDVTHDDLRRVETAQAGGGGAQPPLAYFLPEQRAGLAAQAVIPQPRALETVAAERHVDAER